MPKLNWLLEEGYKVLGFEAATEGMYQGLIGQAGEVGVARIGPTK